MAKCGPGKPEVPSAEIFYNLFAKRHPLPKLAATMNPALETLMLAFTRGNLSVPSRVIFLGAEAHTLLAGFPHLAGWQPLKPKASAWEKSGFTRVDALEGKWPLVMILPGKSREEILAWFAKARALLEPGGTILAALPNTAGAARFEKELASATGKVESLQKHKCRAFYATDNGSWDEDTFAQWLAGGHPREIPTTRFIVEAGIFSSARIDPGSQMLAEHLPASLRGEVADLGAGWGFLSHEISQRCPGITRLDLYEADERALHCAKRNLTTSPLAAHFHWHDVATGLPHKYDAIVMNPPFHDGQALDIDLGRRFIKVAAESLKRGGKLYMVANRQLPYEAALASHGLAWRKIAENGAYKILFADRC